LLVDLTNYFATGRDDFCAQITCRGALMKYARVAVIRPTACVVSHIDPPGPLSDIAEGWERIKNLRLSGINKPADESLSCSTHYLRKRTTCHVAQNHHHAIGSCCSQLSHDRNRRLRSTEPSPPPRPDRRLCWSGIAGASDGNLDSRGGLRAGGAESMQYGTDVLPELPRLKRRIRCRTRKAQMDRASRWPADLLDPRWSALRANMIFRRRGLSGW
jgi:hypothetical protein